MSLSRLSEAASESHTANIEP